MKAKYKPDKVHNWSECLTNLQKLNFILIHEKILINACEDNQLKKDLQNEFILSLLGKVYGNELDSISIFICLLDEFIYKCVVEYPNIDNKKSQSKFLAWYFYDHHGEFCIRNLNYLPKFCLTDFYSKLPKLTR